MSKDSCTTCIRSTNLHVCFVVAMLSFVLDFFALCTYVSARARFLLILCEPLLFLLSKKKMPCLVLPFSITINLYPHARLCYSLPPVPHRRLPTHLCRRSPRRRHTSTRRTSLPRPAWRLSRPRSRPRPPGRLRTGRCPSRRLRRRSGLRRCRWRRTSSSMIQSA